MAPLLLMQFRNWSPNHLHTRSRDNTPTACLTPVILLLPTSTQLSIHAMLTHAHIHTHTHTHTVTQISMNMARKRIQLAAVTLATTSLSGVCALPNGYGDRPGMGWEGDYGDPSAPGPGRGNAPYVHATTPSTTAGPHYHAVITHSH